MAVLTVKNTKNLFVVSHGSYYVFVFLFISWELVQQNNHVRLRTLNEVSKFRVVVK